LPPGAKIGDQNVSAQLREIVRASPAGGEYTAATALDGIERVNVYRKVGRYPFYAIVGMATIDYSGDWLPNSMVLALLTGVVVMTAALTARALYRAAIRDAHGEQAQIELLKLAARDPLTGLANRRRFDEALQTEWLRASRDAKQLSLLMIDVDHFKAYNDAHGHQKGDECLRLVAAAIAREAVRPSDLVARYGGEEFAVILPDTSRRGAVTVAERIRSAVEVPSSQHAGSRGERPITVSVGAATTAASPEGNLAKLVFAADTALYEAKRTGRNRVVSVESA
jgi:diguanylate cyclase (GGDEF)-like protein